MRCSSALIIVGLVVLAGCDPYPSTPTPDYTIRVMRTPDGMVAIPPRCPDNVTAVTDPYDNQPMPQFGCATARNLAFMAEQPEDIVKPRDLGPTRSVGMVGAIRRYDNNQTRGFIYLSPALDTAVDVTTAPSASSPMSGDVTGSASSGSGSSSSSPSSSPSSTSSSGTSSASGP